MTQKQRGEYRDLPLGTYHLCLDRLEGRWLFHSQEDYRLGMASIALAYLKYELMIYAFEWMPNHLHLILSATGEQCMRTFSFIKRRLSERLIKQGYPPLPESYGFKLIPIPDVATLRSQILYTVRNPYEKDYCVPGGSPWGSGYLYFSQNADLIHGKMVKDFSQTKLRALIGSREKLPPEWEIHPVLGVLPRNYIKTEKVESLFSSAKEYMTRLVKEYETIVTIAKTLEEDVQFSETEVRDIVNTELRNTYPGRMFKTLQQGEKCRVAVRLNDKMGLTPKQLAQALFLSELTILQAIRSKDYGIRR